MLVGRATERSILVAALVATLLAEACRAPAGAPVQATQKASAADGGVRADAASVDARTPADANAPLFDASIAQATTADAGTPIVARPLPPPAKVTIEKTCETISKTPREVKRISGTSLPAAHTVYVSCPDLSFADPQQETLAAEKPTRTIVVNSADEYKKLTGCDAPQDTTSRRELRVDFSSERLVLIQYGSSSNSGRRFFEAVKDGRKIHLVFDETHACQGTRTFHTWGTIAIAVPRSTDTPDAIVCYDASPEACRAP